ncbi:uncharacterized protein LOC6526223 [Drosophila yakuba]|uniref:Uncharacterized protein n=1 Tax=Drosophila yakuba TaxID=7245 RepID=B4PZL2_DROYA|nr:uncharacterized protein LOC6526223 [Drosophila yakuba]EDX03140.2 uncharacterized protein Dyak_GE17946 [Drosophila yakuba]
MHLAISTAMAPRKRISRIASRSAAPVEQEIEISNSSSVATQTDVQAAGPPKRKKGQNKVTPLDPHLATLLMPAGNPQTLPVASPETVEGQPDELPSFVPGPNEKACQAVADGTADPGDRVITPNSGERQINYLKSVVSNRREEANLWDRNRLEMLLGQINGDPPPRWNSASQMWLEVDRLEQRIEDYDRGELPIAKKRKVEEDGAQEEGHDEWQGEELEEGQDEVPADEQDERKTPGGT